MQISRTRHKGENNNGKWRLGMQIDLMKRQGLGRSLFCSCTEDPPRLVLLHPRSDRYKLNRGGEREAQERFNSLITALFVSPAHAAPSKRPLTPPLSQLPAIHDPKLAHYPADPRLRSPVPPYGGAAASRAPRGHCVPAPWVTPDGSGTVGPPCSPPAPSQGLASPLGLFSSPFPSPHQPSRPRLLHWGTGMAPTSP